MKFNQRYDSFNNWEGLTGVFLFGKTSKKETDRKGKTERRMRKIAQKKNWMEGKKRGKNL